MDFQSTEGSLLRSLAEHHEVVSRARALIERSRTLQKRASVLADRYVTPEEQASAAVEGALEYIGAAGGMAYRLRRNGSLAFAGACGVPKGLLSEEVTIDSDTHHPVHEVVATLRARIYSIGELEVRFPEIARRLKAAKLGWLSVAPVMWLDSIQGVVAAVYPMSVAPGRREIAALRVLGIRLARNLRNARLYFAETDRLKATTDELQVAASERDAIAAALREEEAANRAKDEFIAVMSHELRTPLSAILGYSELLKDGMAGELTPGQHAMLERLHEGGRQLLELIETLLGISRLRAGSESALIESFDISDTLRRAHSVTAPLAERKGLSLTVRVPDHPVVMKSDEQKILQIIVNLIGNAIKFTERGSVTAELWFADHPSCDAPNSGVELVVRDTGVGIPADQLERIFDPFWQGDRRLVRRQGGAGLGLALVRGYARLLGGRVEVSSNDGHGSTFVVRLPYAAPSSDDSVSAAAPASASR